METMKKAVQTVEQTMGVHLTPQDEASTEARGKTQTTLLGCPIAHNKNSLTAGPHGPVMMQDTILMEKIQHFTREKIPARNVHALGQGCYGKLTVTNDITKYTKADLFSQVGKTTELFVRMSGVFTEQGDPDTFRDLRGFALKFYTNEGNWDLLSINTPVFSVRDGKPGPDAVHAFKRDPRTGEWNPTQKWDYVATHPEGLHQMLMIYSDRVGTPLSYRYMHGYGCNTFSFINAKNERFWVKFHLISQQGAQGLDEVSAKMVAGEDTNFLGRDLREAIARGDYPKWKFCCQIMPEEDGYKKSFAFDCTKVWRHADYPLIDIGIVELNRNVVDYFAEVEQVAFAPSNVVPGIGFSPDKLLQARLLIYQDAQLHRIGPNYKQLPVNRPKSSTPVNPAHHYGGAMKATIDQKYPHYWPSMFGGPQPDPKYLEPPLKCDGPVDYYDYPGEGTDLDYYGQCTLLWQVMNPTQQQHLCNNIASDLYKVPDEVTSKMLQHFQKVDPKLAQGVSAIWKAKKEGSNLTQSEKLLQSINSSLAGNTTTTFTA